jgi:hypothetical protein
MDRNREMEEFRRMRLVARVDRANGLIATYRQHIDYFREQLDVLNHILGRIGERLGDPEPEEPR